MKQAVKIACVQNGKINQKRRNRWAGIIIANYYIETHAAERRQLRKMAA